MMNEISLLKKLQILESELGFKNKQFSGACAVELIKEVLRESGFNVSSRDVFVKDVPIEIDFLIYKDNTKSELGLLFKPEDVLAIFEMKKSGIITDEGKIKVGSDFSRMKTYHPNIKRFYITFSENPSLISDIKKSDESFTFFIRRNGKYSSTGDYDRFIKSLEFLQPHIQP